MPGISEFFSNVGKDLSENAEKAGTRIASEHTPELDHWKPSILDRGNQYRNAYHETMLRPEADGMRRGLGYGAPAAITGGIALGAYNQSQDGNNTSAGVLGAGAAVMGTALALSHFGAVAEGTAVKGISEAIAHGGGTGTTPGLALAEKTQGVAQSVVNNSRTAGNVIRDALGQINPTNAAIAASLVGNKVKDVVTGAADRVVNSGLNATNNVVDAVRSGGEAEAAERMAKQSTLRDNLNAVSSSSGNEGPMQVNVRHPEQAAVQGYTPEPIDQKIFDQVHGIDSSASNAPRSRKGQNMPRRPEVGAKKATGFGVVDAVNSDYSGQLTQDALDAMLAASDRESGES